MKVFVTGGSGFLGRNFIKYVAEKGVDVCALARSQEAANIVTNAGAKTVIRGDLTDVPALKRAMEGCDYVIHGAAVVGKWGKWSEFVKVNVEGTRNVLQCAQECGVKRVVHVGTEAIFATGKAPIRNADESMPLPEDNEVKGFYPRSKLMAEKLVREFASRTNGTEYVIVRPRLIWGRDDTVLIPEFVKACKQGTFRWFNGGTYLTSTAHVLNVCEGLWLASQKGKNGEAYYITDGKDRIFKEFIGALLERKGVDVSKIGNMPLWLFKLLAATCELCWTYLPFLNWIGEPPVVSWIPIILGQEVTVRDDKARRELGYKEVITFSEAMAEI